MRRTGGDDPAGVSDTGGTRPATFQINHAIAHALLSEWASVELAEVRKVWYPPASAGYRDWEPPIDTDGIRFLRAARRSQDTWQYHRTGWVLFCLRTAHRDALRAHYLGTRRVGGRSRAAALAAFCRAWGEWLDSDLPANPL